MMTRKCFWLGCLILTVVMLACEEKQPAGVLSKQQMVSALTEFYLKEARFNAIGVPVDSAAVLLDYYKLKYARQNNFSDSALDVSYQYYMSNPKLLSEIYDQVIDSLALREQKADVPKAVQ
jgi:hypothetical protein